MLKSLAPLTKCLLGALIMLQIGAVPAYAQEESSKALRDVSGIVIPFSPMPLPFKKTSCIETMVIVSFAATGSYITRYNNSKEGNLFGGINKKISDNEYSMTLNGKDCSVTISVKIE